MRSEVLRIQRRVLSAAVIAALVAGTVTACQEQNEAAAPAAPAPAVVVTPVMRSDVVDAFELVGRVEAIDSVDLRARVQGFLIERRFTEGTDVESGDVLFSIDPEPFEAEVQAARAGVAQAEASLTEAERAFVRAEQLLPRGNISQAAYDEALAANLRAEAEVEAQQAALRQAEIELGYTTIEAPLAGRTGKAAYSVGNLVGPDSGVLATVTSLDPIYVDFSVSERDLIEARQDARERGEELDAGAIVLGLRLPNDELYGHDGQITFVGTEVDEQTGTIPIRGQFPNTEQFLVPGAFVTVILSGREARSALLVPQAAIQVDQAGRFVLVVDADNRVAIRRVTTGRQQGTDWVVEDGLQEGEMVIVEGLQRVRPGIEVQPTTMASAAEG